jgi:hypothetical protein
MKMIMDYLRLILFLGAALVGVQVPSFVDLYGVKLNSHWQESKLSLRGFQDDANQYFDGDLQKLVRHYQSKPDPIIVDGGNNIAVLIDRNTKLKQAISEFNQNFYSRYLHTFYSPISEIQQDTWGSYDYAIKLNTTGITWALALGLIFSTLIEGVLRFFGITCLFLLRFASPSPSKE